MPSSEWERKLNDCEGVLSVRGKLVLPRSVYNLHFLSVSINRSTVKGNSVGPSANIMLGLKNFSWGTPCTNMCMEVEEHGYRAFRYVRHQMEYDWVRSNWCWPLIRTSNVLHIQRRVRTVYNCSLFVNVDMRKEMIWSNISGGSVCIPASEL